MFILLSFVYTSNQMGSMSYNGLLFLCCLLMEKEGMHLVDGLVLSFMVQISLTS